MVRVLLLAKSSRGSSSSRRSSPPAMQMRSLREGLHLLGAEVVTPHVVQNATTSVLRQQHRKQPKGRGIPSSLDGPRMGKATKKPPSMGRALAESSSVWGNHSEPYSLIVAEIGVDGVDADVAKLLAQHAPSVQLRSNRKAKPSRGAPLVACVHGDEAPPPLWRFWLPSFCSVAFVREMRLAL